jgi:hypothetical protein
MVEPGTARLFKMASFFRMTRASQTRRRAGPSSKPRRRPRPCPLTQPQSDAKKGSLADSGSFRKTALPRDRTLRVNLVAPHIEFPAILKERI